MVRKNQNSSQLTVENVFPQIPYINQGDSLPSDWKTYNNKDYGFEVKYPENWTAEEFNSAGVGLPVDCKVTPEKCTNFSVKFFSSDPKQRIVVFETSKKDPNSQSKDDSKPEGWSSWDKSIAGHNFVKNSSYFPIYESCWVTANRPDTASLRNDVNGYFFTFYEVPEFMSGDDVEKYCLQEIPDETFDKIVGSFIVTP